MIIIIVFITNEKKEQVQNCFKSKLKSHILNSEIRHTHTHTHTHTVTRKDKTNAARIRQVLLLLKWLAYPYLYRDILRYIYKSISSLTCVSHARSLSKPINTYLYVIASVRFPYRYVRTLNGYMYIIAPKSYFIPLANHTYSH